MKKILVPCDFSEPAIQAFRFATDIAAKSNGQVNLVHAVELPVLYDSAVVLSFEQAYFKDMEESAQKKFRKMKEKWAPERVKIKATVEFGGFMPVLRNAIEKTKADLIVMGTNGAKGLKEYTIGSNAEKLVRTSPVPVIAVRKAPKEIRNIVFPTPPDLGQEELTMKVKALQEFFKAKLHVLFVNTPAEFVRDSETRPTLEAFAKRFMLKNFTLNIFSDITQEDGIRNFTNSINADMIAMRTHGRRGIAHFASGSIAEDVVNHVECPIWTFKIK